MILKERALFTILIPLQTLIFFAFIQLAKNMINFAINIVVINHVDALDFKLFLPLVFIVLSEIIKQNLIQKHIKIKKNIYFNRYFAVNFHINQCNSQKYNEIKNLSKGEKEKIFAITVTISMFLCQFIISLKNVDIFLLSMITFTTATIALNLIPKTSLETKKSAKIIDLCKYFDSINQNITPKFFIKNEYVYGHTYLDTLLLSVAIFCKWLLLLVLSYRLNLNSEVIAILLCMDILSLHHVQEIKNFYIKIINILNRKDNHEKLKNLAIKIDKLTNFSAENVTIFRNNDSYDFNFNIKKIGLYFIASDVQAKIQLFFDILYQRIMPNKGSFCINNYGISQLNFSLFKVHGDWQNIGNVKLESVARILHSDFNKQQAISIFKKLYLEEFLGVKFTDFLQESVSNFSHPKQTFLLNLFLSLTTKQNIITIENIDSYLSAHEIQKLIPVLNSESVGFVFILTQNIHKDYPVIKI